MARENVLELKIVKMNNEYSACTITKQNDDVIERGKFKFEASNGLVISSLLFPIYSNVSENMMLDIRGLDPLRDNKIIIISNKDMPLIEQAVQELNQKHGTVTHWRAKKHEKYYFVNFYTLDVLYEFEKNTIFSKILYPTGNYFKTEKQAKECAERIKKVIKEYHEEIGE